MFCCSSSKHLLRPLFLLSACSEELQLPPELKAYLEELEAQEHGGHGGGWVHSGIAERLSSSDDFPGLE